MHFLCLHGAGTSGAIFKAQTASFRARLPPGKHTFDFIDGPHEIPTDTTSAAVSPFFKPPYYTFLRSYTDQAEIDAAPKFVLDYIRRSGKRYDACLAFSQGAAVVSGIIMRHQAELERAAVVAEEKIPEQLPFRAAVFICGGPPLPILNSLGLRVSERAWEITRATSEDLAHKTRAVGEQVRQIFANDDGKRKSVFVNPWAETGTLAHDFEAVHAHRQSNAREVMPRFPTTRTITSMEIDGTTKQDSLADVYGMDLRPSHLPSCTKISIPTCHVYGSKDPRYPAGVQLALFCDSDVRRVYDTGGAHEILRDKVTSEEIAHMIEWLERQIR